MQMGEHIKYIMLQFIVCLAKKAGKKFIVGDTGAGYAGKMLSMAAKKFGLKCKIFMGAKDIYRQQPNVNAMKKMVLMLYQYIQVAKHL